MPTPNLFFALQTRLQTLVAAHPCFAGPLQSQLLTDQVGDLATAASAAIQPAGIGVIITTAAGKSSESEFETLLSMDDLNLSVVSNPTTDPSHNALDAVAAIIQAVEN